MPFITAGDPDLNTTLKLIRELAQRGVDFIEIGFPYSDPIADGPVIQASYTRALGKGLRIPDIFTAIRSLAPTKEAIPPLVAMVAYAIIYRFGIESFVRQASDAGFSGLIVPDLPAEEAGELRSQSLAHGMDLIHLISPTTTPERAESSVRSAGGFLYCISVAGITGERDQLPAELRTQLEWLKSKTPLPLAVGFGISKPEQVHGLRGLADGVIVGSAFVRQVAALSEGKVSESEMLTNCGELAEKMLAQTHHTAGHP